MSHPVNDIIYDNMEDRYEELYTMYIDKGYPPYIAEDRAKIDVREEMEKLEPN
jgi:hypothetical protein